MQSKQVFDKSMVHHVMTRDIPGISQSTGDTRDISSARQNTKTYKLHMAAWVEQGDLFEFYASSRKLISAHSEPYCDRCMPAWVTLASLQQQHLIMATRSRAPGAASARRRNAQAASVTISCYWQLDSNTSNLSLTSACQLLETQASQPLRLVRLCRPGGLKGLALKCN